ncbi:MAG: hypothetical protein IJ009_07400 [Clostridia bacterium]|nr:hypothetical protein [Clostridia bacterium]
MLITVIGLSVVLLIFAAVLPLLFSDGEETPKPPSFVFADATLSADPQADEDYMALDRTVYYRILSAYEVTVSIHEEDLSRLDAELVLLFRLVQAAMAGDHEAYNACFSPEYVASDGKVEAFTKQKLYDITFTLYEGTEQTVPVGYSSVRAYGLTYKIKDNNGSLRNDMGSDAMKEQLFFVVKDAAGVASVYAVQT